MGRRVHTVQPWHLVFDTASKHLYLDAYRVEVITSHGPWREGQWSKYRLGRILADGIQILPDKFPATPPKRPRHDLEYLLSPEIARLGEISHHFDDLAVHETDSAGWVRVTATTDDLFRATRLLMSYAHNCKLIGGPEARREMAVLVQAVARMYGVIRANRKTPHTHGVGACEDKVGWAVTVRVRSRPQLHRAGANPAWRAAQGVASERFRRRQQTLMSPVTSLRIPGGKWLHYLIPGGFATSKLASESLKLEFCGNSVVPAALLP
ncbi:MAG: WYL domain-containing protein [Anaerolineales bacterium]|nr:WYL domain-containing protein [Anaerolineales bacterium]